MNGLAVHLDIRRQIKLIRKLREFRQAGIEMRQGRFDLLPIGVGQRDALRRKPPRQSRATLRPPSSSWLREESGKEFPTKRATGSYPLNYPDQAVFDNDFLLCPCNIQEETRKKRQDYLNALDIW